MKYKTMEKAVEALLRVEHPDTLHTIAKILRPMVSLAKERNPETREFTAVELGALMSAYHRIESQYEPIKAAVPAHTALKPPINPPEKPVEPLDGRAASVDLPPELDPSTPPEAREKYWEDYSKRVYKAKQA